MVLDRIKVERSPICRPDSDCWDVVVTFVLQSGPDHGSGAQGLPLHRGRQRPGAGDRRRTAELARLLQLQQLSRSGARIRNGWRPADPPQNPPVIPCKWPKTARSVVPQARYLNRQPFDRRIHSPSNSHEGDHHEYHETSEAGPRRRAQHPKAGVALGAAGNGVRPSVLFDMLSSIASKSIPFISGGLGAVMG
jgi:hypothetical protein